MSTETPNWVYGTKSSFAAGELTPTIEGRADLPLYQSGAKKIINWMILPSGGLTRRPGTEFIWAKMRASKTRVSQSIDGKGVDASSFSASDSDDESLDVLKDTMRIPVSGAPVPASQDATSRLYRLTKKIEGNSLFFDYGVLDEEDAAYKAEHKEEGKEEA
jgi:hypothetical protein